MLPVYNLSLLFWHVVGGCVLRLAQRKEEKVEDRGCKIDDRQIFLLLKTIVSNRKCACKCLFWLDTHAILCATTSAPASIPRYRLHLFVEETQQGVDILLVTQTGCKCSSARMAVEARPWGGNGRDRNQWGAIVTILLVWCWKVYCAGLKLCSNLGGSLYWVEQHREHLQTIIHLPRTGSIKIHLWRMR